VLTLYCILYVYAYISTRSPAFTRITNRTGCQWPSRLSKVDDFHLIWNGVCHFLL